MHDLKFSTEISTEYKLSKNKELFVEIKKFKKNCKKVLTTEKGCNIKRVTGRKDGLQDRKVLCGVKETPGYKTSE